MSCVVGRGVDWRFRFPQRWVLPSGSCGGGPTSNGLKLRIRAFAIAGLGEVTVERVESPDVKT